MVDAGHSGRPCRGRVLDGACQGRRNTMAALPTALSPEHMTAAESELAGWAREYHPGEVANLGRSLIDLLDADTLEEREQRGL